MKRTTLDLLACPFCRGRFDFSGADEKTLLAGTLTCFHCSKVYPIVNGIPHFIEPSTAAPSLGNCPALAGWVD
jgi:uncharacterized protein YbaR (Trm112 family)